MKYLGLAVAAGVAAGLLAAAGSLVSPSLAYPTRCVLDVCTSAPSFVRMVVGALGVVLVFDSAVSFVGPRITLYGQASISLLLAVFLASAFGEANEVYFWPTLALALLTAGLSLAAARSKSGLTEQSNPMNLPVFG